MFLKTKTYTHIIANVKNVSVYGALCKQTVMLHRRQVTISYEKCKEVLKNCRQTLNYEDPLNLSFAYYFRGTVATLYECDAY